MRMAEFHVDGFGRLADLSVGDIPPGLSIVLGNNEAGKTTLLAFLSSVLFGLPNRNQAAFCPPLRGGQKGGRIVLVDGQSERIIVERHGGPGIGPLTVTFPDGQQGGEEELRQLMGSATADLYRSVFAFSLSELQTFDSLNTDKVRDAIYSAGIGIGRRTMTDVIRDLNGQAAGLFAPRAQNPVMNQVLSRVESLRKQIRDRQGDQDDYERIQAELEASESTVQRIGAALSEARERFERVRLLLQAWEDWIALGDRREQLKPLPQIDSFPEDGVRRLDALTTEQRGFRDQMKETVSARESEERKLAAVVTEEVLLSVADDVRRIDRNLKTYENDRQEFSSFQTKRKLAEQTLAGMLSELGEEWDEEKLREFDLSVPVREEMDACRRGLQQATDDVRQRQVQGDQEQKQLEEARELVDEIQSQLEKLPHPSESFDVEGVRRLQLGRESYESAARDLPGVEKQCEMRVGHLHDTLRNMGPNWTEDRLRAFDTSLAVQEEVSTHQTRLAEAQSEQKDAARRARDARQALDDAQADLRRAEETLSAMPELEVTDETGLAERRRSLRALRSQLNEAGKQKARLEVLDERKRALDTQEALLKEDRKQEPFRLPWWVELAVAALGLAGLLVLGIGRGEWASGGIVFGLCAIVAIVLAVARLMSAAGEKGKPADRRSELKVVADQRVKLRQETDELRGELASLDSKIPALFMAAGFDGVPDWRAVDAAEADTERHLESLQQRRPFEKNREDAERNRDRAEQAVSRTEKAEADKTNHLHETQGQWRQWLAAAGLPETLTPVNASNVLARLDAAREQLKAIESDRERIGRMKGAIREYEEQVEAAATTSGLDHDLPQEPREAVDFLTARLEEHERRSRDLAEATRRLEEAEERATRAKNQTDQAENSYRQAVDTETQCRQQWTGWLERFGLRASLQVESAPQMLQSIELARSQLGKVDELGSGEHTSRESVDSYCDEVRSVAKAAGRAEPAEDEVSKAVSGLTTDLDQAEENHRHALSLTERIKGYEERIDLLQSQIDERQREIDELLRAAGASDEEAFRRSAADYEARRQTQEQIRQLETRLRQVAGSGDALELLEQQLEGTTPEELNAEKKTLDETIKTKDAERTAAADERGRLKEKLDALESSEELSRLRVEEQAARAEFTSGAEQWSILKIAAHLVDRAREKYERERRPAVLIEAGRYFSQFTGGNYKEVRAPLGGDHRVIVVAPDGSTKEVEQLSRGTAEQLYLSLRFGFVREFVRRSEPLPLVFDDILVNFDPGRARAAAEAMLDLSESLQMLLFTCHPATVDLIKSVDSSVPIFGLKDGCFSDVTHSLNNAG